MEDLDFGALDESKFEQPALYFGRREAMQIFIDMNQVDTPAESTACLAQGHAGCN
jgi:hypothetical protein